MKIPSVQLDQQSRREYTRNIARLAESARHGIASISRNLIRRAGSDSSACQPGDNSAACQSPASVQNTQTIAIILGVVIPLSCAVCVLIYLHRRHMKKQRLEDINDPHKSLDFGMDGVEPIRAKGSKGRRGPEMRGLNIGGASSRKMQGLSLDAGMVMDSPYILPAGLNGSRESFHSMSRSMRDEHDPYRPVTQLARPSVDNESVRFGRLNDDKGSLYSMSTDNHPATQDRAGLVANARPMSQSFGRKAEAMSPVDATSSSDFSRPIYNAPTSARATSHVRTASLDHATPTIEKKDLPPPPPPPPMVPEPVAFQMPPPRSSSKSDGNSLHPPRTYCVQTADQRPESSNYGDEDSVAPVQVTIHEPEPYEVNPAGTYLHYSVAGPPPQQAPALYAPQPVAPQRLSIMGVRPLPPDVPDDNPEIRANRIRSFYKEYFDDSKPPPANGQYPGGVYSEYMDGVVYDPDSGGFFAGPNKPFAEGPARRAMTPPPRSRPRVSGNSQAEPHHRQYSTMSAGRPRGRSLPKKKLSPPKALTDLPTPYLMRDDSVIFNAADFAPPTTFRNMQNGSRPASPTGMQRPYSPSVRAFTPLASSFDHLAALPSPHDLRRSGTFTALDFAPPSKIRDPMHSPSDAGSIRSNRSNMSAMQMNAVREGAYRVSRIPKEFVTTRDDLSVQLRPRMNLTSSA